MTREWFIENITRWHELIDFCNDEECNYCDDVYDSYAKDEYFDDDIVEMARNSEGWRDLYQRLDDIPTGYDYYIRDEYDEWRGADYDDFDNYKSDVLDWGDENEIWDEEDVEEVLEEENDEDEEEGDEDGLEPEEGCSLGELFTSCTSKLQIIEIEAERERKQEKKEFEQFISAVV